METEFRASIILIRSCEFEYEIKIITQIKVKLKPLRGKKTGNVHINTVENIGKQVGRLSILHLGGVIIQDSPSLMSNKLHHFFLGTGSVTKTSQKWTVLVNPRGLQIYPTSKVKTSEKHNKKLREAIITCFKS